MWRKSWSWKEMSLKYLYFTQYLFLFIISSPRTWQIWVHSLKLCIGSITLNFCYLADDETPILNCPNISSTTDGGLNSSSTVLLNPTVTDNVDFHVDVICSHTSDDIFLIGDTTVNCSSTDAASLVNTDTCRFVVTVRGENVWLFFMFKSSFTDWVKGYGICNSFWKMFSFFKTSSVPQIVILKSFCSISHVESCEETSWSWNEIYLTIYILTWYLFFFMIFPPGSLQT